MIGPWYVQLGSALFVVALFALVIWAVVRWDERRIAREIAAESARAASSPRPVPRYWEPLEPLEPVLPLEPILPDSRF
jgi:hypothetical protein